MKIFCSWFECVFSRRQCFHQEAKNTLMNIIPFLWSRSQIALISSNSNSRGNLFLANDLQLPRNQICYRIFECVGCIKPHSCRGGTRWVKHLWNIIMFRFHLCSPLFFYRVNTLCTYFFVLYDILLIGRYLCGPASLGSWRNPV